jgi:hypothetical protein
MFIWLADFRRIAAFVIYWYEAWPSAARRRHPSRRRANDYFSIHGNFDAITRTLEQRTW